MTRVQRVLLVVIAIELVGGGCVAAWRMMRPAPPQADWSLLDDATAMQIRDAIAECKSAGAWRDLGELYMAAGCFQESERCHRVACDMDPDNAVFARQWAFALERLALLEDANTQYRRALALKSADPDTDRYFIARNLLRADKPDEARAVFAEGKSLAANRYELARLHLRAGEFAQADELLKGLLAERPDELQVHLLGYRLELERGNLRRAFFHGDHARYAPKKLLNPFDDQAERIVNATKALGANRPWQEAHHLMKMGWLDEAAKLLQGTERESSLLELRAEIAMRQERHETALPMLEELQPTARVLARIGDARQAAGQHAKARDSWLRAVQLGAGADLKTIHHKLSDSFVEAGDKTTAHWHRARGHYYLGRALMQHGHPDKAVGPFEDAVQDDPTMAQAWFYLGEAHRLVGHKEPARTAYRACLKLNPEHGKAIASLAYLLDDSQ